MCQLRNHKLEWSMILMDYSQQYALALMDMLLDTFWCKSREQEYVVKNTESNIQLIVIIYTIYAICCI